MKLAVNLAGLVLKNPVTVASGTFANGREYARLWQQNGEGRLSALGALTTKGVSANPWPGNSGVRITESASGILNSIGLQNPGVEAFCAQELPWLNAQELPVIVNVSGHSAQEYASIIERLEAERETSPVIEPETTAVIGADARLGVQPDAADARHEAQAAAAANAKSEVQPEAAAETRAGTQAGAGAKPATGIAAYEVNISCPNVDCGGISFGTSPKAAAEVTSACRAVLDKTASGRPLLIKLTPNVTEITEIARACESAGADALSLINTVAGMAVNLRQRKAVFKRVVAGLSGQAIKPVALYAVYRVHQAVRLPLLGMGGISSGEDAIEFILAGATAVAVGSASFTNPLAALNVIQEIEQWCEANGVQDINELIGALT